MNKKEGKNIFLGFLIGITFILIVIIGLFETNTIIIKSKNNNKIKTKESNKNSNNSSDTDIYKNFLNDKEYLNDLSEADDGAKDNIKYTYYDLNNDGIKELIIYISDDSAFGTNLFYTCYNNEINLISKIYHYGNLVYNKKENAIVYTEIRPSLSYGYAYGFYQLKEDKFDLIKTVGVSIENEKETYFVDDETITKKEYDEYFKNNINFNYQETK